MGVKESDVVSKKLKDFIYDANCFVVPDYQRGYVWQSDNVKDLLNTGFTLWEQYQECKDCDSQSFIGTCVLQLVSEDVEKKVYDIVDGQQRLTTLFLMLLVAKSMGDKERPLDKGGLKLSFSLREVCDDFLQNLWIVADDKNVLSYLESVKKSLDYCNNKSLKNMVNACECIYDFLQDLIDNGVSIEDFVDFYLFHLFCVCLVTDNINTAMQLFEHLNTTGMKLHWSDIVYSHLLRYIEADRHKEYAEKLNSIITTHKNRFGTEVSFSILLFIIGYMSIKKGKRGIVCDKIDLVDFVKSEYNFDSYSELIDEIEEISNIYLEKVTNNANLSDIDLNRLFLLEFIFPYSDAIMPVIAYLEIFEETSFSIFIKLYEFFVYITFLTSNRSDRLRRVSCKYVDLIMDSVNPDVIIKKLVDDIKKLMKVNEFKRRLKELTRGRTRGIGVYSLLRAMIIKSEKSGKSSEVRHNVSLNADIIQRQQKCGTKIGNYSFVSDGIEYKFFEENDYSMDKQKDIDGNTEECYRLILTEFEDIQ